MTLDEARVIYEKKLCQCLYDMPPDTVYYRFKKHINALYYTVTTLIEDILFHPNEYQYSKEDNVSSISGRIGYIKINETESRVEISVKNYLGRPIYWSFWYNNNINKDRSIQDNNKDYLDSFFIIAPKGSVNITKYDKKYLFVKELQTSIFGIVRYLSKEANDNLIENNIELYLLFKNIIKFFQQLHISRRSNLKIVK